MMAASPISLTAPGAPDKIPPHNFEAEQALLGAIFMRNSCFDGVADFLRGEHFADPVHGRIFDACAALIAKGRRADPVVLKDILADDAGLQDQGGATYLVRLAGSAASIMNAEDYGRLILDLHRRRVLIGIGEDMVNAAFDMADPDVSADRIQEDAEQAMFSLSENSTDGTKQAIAFDAAAARVIASAEMIHKSGGTLTGLTTGLADLDKKLGGLHRTDLIILAGRPSMGKTAAAVNIAENAAQDLRGNGGSGTVLIFSLEMSAEQLGARILSRKTKIPGHRLRNGPISGADIDNLCDARTDLDGLPMEIDDTPALSVAAIRTRARRAARKRGGLALIVIDYLQLIGNAFDRSRSRRGGSENRTQELTEITRCLKALAKELNTPVLALSQLSREVEKRDDKRPQLADLRDSGSIEQDADVVMFVYREQYYLERSEPKEGTKKYDEWQKAFEACVNTGDIIIGKQRHGSVGTVRLHYHAETTTFSDLYPMGAATNHVG
jgi:replicative DNA helicase